MIPWVVIDRRHHRQPRKSRALPRLFLFNIPTCKCAVRIPDAPSGPSNIPTFGFPYPLPSSVSRNSFICHSYENTGGVWVFFPLWKIRPVSTTRTHFSIQVLSFHTLPNSFALAKNSTRFVSSNSKLFHKNTRGWGYVRPSNLQPFQLSSDVLGSGGQTGEGRR